jgi:hypothetical protein
MVPTPLVPNCGVVSGTKILFWEIRIVGYWVLRYKEKPCAFQCTVGK